MSRQIQSRSYLIPIHLDENHWSLLVFNINSKQIINFDSLYNIDKNIAIISNLISILSKYVTVLKGAQNWNFFQNYSAPRQSGDIDCGVFVCQYANEVHSILNMKQFDIICFCETKIEDSYPNSFYKNDYYYKIRLDRSRHGGGLIIFIKNSFVLTKSVHPENTELIYLQFRKSGQLNNFIYTFRAPNLKEQLFLEKLEDFIHSINLNEPLFIVGNLNMDFSDKIKSNISKFADHNDLINFVKTPTSI
ncbi:unnamed protein product [Brachionus calyciflorus]|uniref:Ubiquitin-like protease family profile domain-containing protein n=1 Tax=Brachionus calyciflorus TaxID=104777 RepID=A0A814G229_9BILA|nr:unnamed protein product [Brachionus calyciflorus]